VKRQPARLTRTHVRTWQSPDHQRQDRKKSAGEKVVKIQRLLRALTANFPHVEIGIMNREMQLGLLGGDDIPETETISLPPNRPIARVYPHLDEEAQAKLKHVFNGQRVHFEISTGSGYYEVTAIPLVEPDNQVNEALCVMQDLTEQKLMQEGLLKALEREKELGELKSRFVTMASHEFRTPLTSILASTFLLENLSEASYDKDKKIHTNRIKRSVNNLTTILNEFLSLQKLEENKIKVVQTDIHVPEFIQDDLIGEMDVLKKAGQSIDYRHEGQQQMAHLDHHLVWSIITNLLSNSLKYSKPGDRITVVSETRDNSLILKVTDPGIGIPEDEHKNIFGRFYRARNATNIEGTGLGLHIVQKYVHLLNGTITFESKLDKGTSFTVTLPDAYPQHSSPDPSSK
jgi:signal transduction histidine kinase